MTLWHVGVTRQLRASGMFVQVTLSGGKVRASLSETLFLDIHFDPTSHSYSYAFIDLTLPYAGDKRRFGWDDFPHPGDETLGALGSHPHHFQERLPDGRWRFAESKFRGKISREIPEVLAFVRHYLLENHSE
jgi:hypothetical protein